MGKKKDNKAKMNANMKKAKKRLERERLRTEGNVPTNHPTTETYYPTIATDFPTTETYYPTVKTDFPTTETYYPTIETAFPTASETSASRRLQREDSFTRIPNTQKESRKPENPRIHPPHVYFAVFNPAQVEKLGSHCKHTQAIGNAVLTFDGNDLCIRMGYRRLGHELASYLHGPAEVGEDGSIISGVTKGFVKNDCVRLNDRDIRLLRRGEMYVQVQSKRCRQGELRGQILPTALS